MPRLEHVPRLHPQGDKPPSRHNGCGKWRSMSIECNSWLSIISNLHMRWRPILEQGDVKRSRRLISKKISEHSSLPLRSRPRDLGQGDVKRSRRLISTRTSEHSSLPLRSRPRDWLISVVLRRIGLLGKLVLRPLNTHSPPSWWVCCGRPSWSKDTNADVKDTASKGATRYPAGCQWNNFSEILISNFYYACYELSPDGSMFHEDQLLDHKMKSENHICCGVCGQDFRSEAGRDKHVLLVGHTKVCCKVPPKISYPTTHKILLLKRSPAEKLFPYHWEIPGGKVDDTDKTIWDALKREVNEETGLCIKESEVTQAEMGLGWALDEDVVGEDVEDDMEMALELNL